MLKEWDILWVKALNNAQPMTPQWTERHHMHLPGLEPLLLCGVIIYYPPTFVSFCTEMLKIEALQTCSWRCWTSVRIQTKRYKDWNRWRCPRSTGFISISFFIFALASLNIWKLVPSLPRLMFITFLSCVRSDFVEFPATSTTCY